MEPKIRVAWSRRSLLEPGMTTDEDGYSLYEFSFNTGERIKKYVRQENMDCSSYQRLPFTTKAYLTKVEVWLTKNHEEVFIYAEPSNEIKEHLPDK